MNGGKNISDCSNVIIVSLRVKRTNSFVWLSSGSATTSFIYYSRRYLTDSLARRINEQIPSSLLQEEEMQNSKLIRTTISIYFRNE